MSGNSWSSLQTGSSPFFNHRYRTSSKYIERRSWAIYTIASFQKVFLVWSLKSYFQNLGGVKNCSLSMFILSIFGLVSIFIHVMLCPQFDPKFELVVTCCGSTSQLWIFDSASLLFTSQLLRWKIGVPSPCLPVNSLTVTSVFLFLFLHPGNST